MPPLQLLLTLYQPEQNTSINLITKTPATLNPHVT